MGFADPYAVLGATIDAAQLRRMFYLETKGQSGVDSSTALKVVGIAGSPGLLGIMPGGGSVAVTSRREAYGVYNDAMDGDAIIEVPPAEGTARTWHVIIDVFDPQYEGQSARVWPRLVSSLSGRPRPFLHLATFTLPAGAGFDVTTPITDMRRIANPLELSGQRMGFPSTDTNMPTNNYSRWPDRAVEVYVPEWARWGLVTAHLSGIEINHQGGRTVAGIRTYLGPAIQQPGAQIGRELGENGIIVDPGGSVVRRHHVSIAGRHDVRWARGTNQYVMTQGYRTEGSGTFQADYQTTISTEWTFVEDIE